MFRKFISGAVFGSGFALAFCAILFVWFIFALPVAVHQMTQQTLEHFEPSEQVIEPAETSSVENGPHPHSNDHYLGSRSAHSGAITYSTSKRIIMEGPGRIAGRATANGQPVEGLKLRLALTRTAWSDWLITSKDGEYQAHVPYGDYEILGYEIDNTSANALLAGMIDFPQINFHIGTITVSEKSDGPGPPFEFVTAVRKQTTQREFSSTEEIVLRWHSHSDADGYQIEIVEKSDPYRFGQTRLIDFHQSPKLKENRAYVSDLGITLKTDHYYRYGVRALDETGQSISRTPDRHIGYDFKVVN